MVEVIGSFLATPLANKRVKNHPRSDIKIGVEMKKISEMHLTDCLLNTVSCVDGAVEDLKNVFNLVLHKIRKRRVPLSEKEWNVLKETFRIESSSQGDGNDVKGSYKNLKSHCSLLRFRGLTPEILSPGVIRPATGNRVIELGCMLNYYTSLSDDKKAQISPHCCE